jgi:hemerythrin superfamily protein
MGERMTIKETFEQIVGSAADKVTGEERPDALALLKEDHQKVKELFSEVLKEDAGKMSRRRKTIDTILKELALHAKVEESLLYPAMAARTKKASDDREQVLEAFEEHGSMKDLMKKIERSAPSDESLKAKVQVLSEIVDHHVREEEASLFPEARRLLGADKLHEMGSAILKLKRRANAGSKKTASRAKASARKAKTKTSG